MHRLRSRLLWPRRTSCRQSGRPGLMMWRASSRTLLHVLRSSRGSCMNKPRRIQPRNASWRMLWPDCMMQRRMQLRSKCRLGMKYASSLRRQRRHRCERTKQHRHMLPPGKRPRVRGRSCSASVMKPRNCGRPKTFCLQSTIVPCLMHRRKSWHLRRVSRPCARSETRCSNRMTSFMNISTLLADRLPCSAHMHGMEKSKMPCKRQTPLTMLIQPLTHLMVKSPPLLLFPARANYK